MDEFKDKTDEELEGMREAASANSYVPSSIFHRIDRELERRHRKRLEEAAQRPTSTNIGILNNGNNPTITGNTFISGSASKNPSFWKKPENIIGILSILVLIALTIIGWLYFSPKQSDTRNDSSQKQISNSIVTTNQVGSNTLVTNPIPSRLQQDFNASSLKNDFTASSSDQIVHLRLSNYPIPDSVEVWWGAMSLTPSDFWVVGKDIQVDLLSDQAKAIQDVTAGSADDSNLGFVVTYIPNSSDSSK